MKSLYRITSSDLDTVRVGTYVIDYDEGRSKNWHIWNAATGSFERSFAGVRTHRLCETCLGLAGNPVRPLGHDHPHGEGPILDPTVGAERLCDHERSAQ